MEYVGLEVFLSESLLRILLGSDWKDDPETSAFNLVF